MKRAWAWLVWWFVGRRRALLAWERYRFAESKLRILEDATFKHGERPSLELLSMRNVRDDAHSEWMVAVGKRP